MRDRIRPGIAFVRIAERHVDPGLVARHRVIRDADRRALVRAAAEVGMDRGAGPDGGDVRVGLGIDRQAVDGRVPHVVRREHRAAGHGALGGRAPPGHRHADRDGCQSQCQAAGSHHAGTIAR